MRGVLEGSFAFHAAYLQAGSDPERVDLLERSPENSRPFRALKVWLALQAYGRDGYSAMIERNIRLAAYLESLVDATPGLAMAAPRELSIVCWRVEPPALGGDPERLERLQGRIIEELERRGHRPHLEREAPRRADRPPRMHCQFQNRFRESRGTCDGVAAISVTSWPPSSEDERMARLQRRRFTEPDDVRTVPHGRIDVVELDDRVVGRMSYEPGWRWSVDVKPIAGTDSCQFHHFGVTLGGRVRVEMRDGTELEIGPGDVFEIPPGHDAWVVGDEPWISVDFEAMRAYGRTEPASGRRTLFSILFTDIVDSTAQAVARGPAAWRDIVRGHNELAERRDRPI